jgi:hypothetical protein
VAVEYKTFSFGKVDTSRPLWEEDVPKKVDHFIALLRKDGWHRPHVWTVGDAIYVTVWRED